MNLCRIARLYLLEAVKMRPGEIGASILILVLIALFFVAIAFNKWRLSRVQKAKQIQAEEGQMKQVDGSSKNSKPTAPKLPLFKTRSSLSMSSSPVSPRAMSFPTSTTSGFGMVSKNQPHSRSGSIDGLPSVETVLEQYEQEADAVERHDKVGRNQILKDEDIGEPGPSVVDGSTSRTKSAWDRPHIAERAAGKA